MHDTPIEWLRRPPLRSAELLAHASSIVAVTLTIVMVGTAQASESNPVTAWLIANGGLTTWALLTPLLVAGGFVFIRWTNRRGAGRWATAAAWTLSIPLTADALGNLVALAYLGPPESAQWALVGQTAAIMALLAAVFVLRPSPRRAMRSVGHTRTRQAAAVAACLFLVVAGIPAPIFGPGGSLNPIDNAAAATLPDGFEDGDITEWGGDTDTFKTTTGQAYAGSYSMVDTNDNTISTVTISFSSRTTESFGVAVRINGSHGQTPVLKLTQSGSGSLFELDIDNGNLEYTDSSGSDVDTGIDLAKDEWHFVTITDIDYSNDNGTVEIDGGDGGSATIEMRDTGTTEYDGFSTSNNYNGKIWIDEVGGTYSTKADFSGEVVDQHGDPVAGATVGGVAYRNNLTDSIDAVRKKISDPTPPNWDADLNLKGSDGPMRKPGGNGRYVAVHTSEEWGVPDGVGSFVNPLDPEAYRLGDDPTLERPRLKIAEEDSLILTLWDKDEESNFVFEDTVDEDLPGQTVSGEIVVEQIDADNGTISTVSPNTSDYFRTGYLGIERKTHEAVVMDLSPGFYRVYPDGNPSSAYVIVVAPDADPNKLTHQWIQEWENEESQLTARAQDLQSHFDDGTFEFVSTDATDADGTWTANSTDTSLIEKVDWYAYKTSVSVPNSEYDGSSPSWGEITNFYDTEIADIRDGLESGNPATSEVCEGTTEKLGAVYQPSDTVTTGAPADNITLVVTKQAVPDKVRTANKLCYLNEVAKGLLEGGFADLIPTLLQRLDQMSLEELQRQFDHVAGGGMNNPHICDAALQNLGQGDVSDCYGGTQPPAGGGGGGAIPDTGGDGWYGDPGSGIPADPGDATREELEDATDAVGDAIDEVGEDTPSGEVEVVVDGNDSNVSASWDSGFDDLSEDEVLVRVDFNNGTTTYLNGSSEYVTIEDSLVGSDTVHLEEYPLGDNEAANVRFMAITSEGISEASSAVRSPSFTGDIPALKSVHLSTTAPGPDDRVQVVVNPEDDSRFGKLKSITVTNLDDTSKTIDVANITKDKETAFTTNGSGVHRVELTIENPGGVEFTEVVEVEADDNALARGPTIRANSGPMGTYAVASDGCTDGEFIVDQGGAAITGTCVLNEGADPPESVHAHITGLDTSDQYVTDVRVLRGESEETVRAQVLDYVHAPSLGEHGFVYRTVAGDEQALPRNGTNQFGTVSRHDDGVTIQSFSDDRATFESETFTEPSFIQRTFYRVRAQFPRLSGVLPGMTAPPPIPSLSLLAGAFVLGGTRRWGW